MGRTAKISAGIITITFLLSLFSSFIVPYDPNAIDLDSLKQPPSLKHILGNRCFQFYSFKNHENK